MIYGSPPRMRGKLGFLGFCGAPDGITPADAGKTCCTCRWFCQFWDHPRGCGENLGCVCTNDLKKGSPPRMRGKRRSVSGRSADDGITPADAGKTCLVLGASRPAPDHPRGCGENGVHQPRLGGSGGSPPRMRGKQGWTSRDLSEYRITPADAGKTRRR